MKGTLWIRAYVMDFLEQKAENAESSGDLETALELWSQLAIRNHDPVFFCRSGRVAETLHLWDKAEDAFSRALQVDKNFSLGLECMGSLWLTRTDKGREESLLTAKDWFSDALKHERSARVLTFLGNTYMALGNEPAARQSFEEAIKLDPNYEEALFNLASIESRSNRRKAGALLERAIDIDPEYSAAHLQLGILWEKDGDLAQAEYHLRRALKLNPADYWAHMYLANLLGVQGKSAEAEQTYRFATTLHPEITEGTEIFARFLDSLGKEKEATAIRQRSEPSSQQS